MVVTVTLDAAASQGVGDNQGYIVFDGPAHDAHMPVWARVIPAATKDVLIIDNDQDPAETVAESLERIGCRCRVAGSGARAVTPCGRCRQVISELAALDGADPPVWCADGESVLELRLSQLLPHAFGPGDLDEA